MSIWDWILVVALNGSIIAYGIYLSRGVRSSSDWFLAGRQLPWWLVGLSMYATAIDSSDLIADSGGTYTLGLSMFVMNWVGVVAGWALAAFFVFLPMYRAGMYTNAEYLEARYGTTVRVISVLVQVQYRTSVLAIMSGSVYYTLHVVCGWGTSAWWAVATIALVASVYTALGGLRSVAVTDALQFIIMTVAALVIWVLVWNEVGGWDGIEQRLTASDADLAARLLHVGHDDVVREDVSDDCKQEIPEKLLAGGQYDPHQGIIVRRTSAWLVSLAWVIVGVGYSIVNHTQAMRMFATKSEWDLKMCVCLAGATMLAMSFFNLSIGVMGRALFPDQSLLPDGKQDAIYPLLVSQLTTVGLRGIVVAGILAAALSTYDSIGATLSALLTRDVYARLIVRSADDHHYWRVGQWLTPVVIASSFLYLPFMLEGGMLLFFLDITSTFVTPLLTLYLMGTFTRVHRRSGLIGFLAGATYGVLRLVVAPTMAQQFGIAILPPAMMNSFAAYTVSMIVTAGTMVIVSLLAGWESPGELLHEEQTGWLRSSQVEVRELQRAANTVRRSAWSRHLPVVLTAIVVAMGCVLSFVIFW